MGLECIAAIIFGGVLFFALRYFGGAGTVPWIVRGFVVLIALILIGWGIFECFSQIPG